MDPRIPSPAAHGGPVRALLATMVAEPEGLLARIGADVGEPEDRVRPALERHVELIGAVSADLAEVADLAGGSPDEAGAGVPGPGAASVLDRLREDGAAAAGRGERLEHLLDRHLSAGWVIWEAASSGGGASAPILAALGSALLRAGDLAAAAIADGFGATERERVARHVAMLRGIVHELLEPAPAGQVVDARLARATAAAGIPTDRPLRVIVGWLGEAVDDEDARVAQVTRAIVRPPRSGQPADPLPAVVTRRGRLVILDVADRPVDPRLSGALSAAAPGGWWAVAADPSAHPAALAGRAADAFAALEVALRGPAPGRVAEAGELALERALLADEPLLRAAVDRELGLLLAAPRSGPELVETLVAYLAEGMSVMGAARRLHLAPRTITYRLERIGELRGAPLDAAAWRRYAVLLAARDLLAGAG